MLAGKGTKRREIIIKLHIKALGKRVLIHQLFNEKMPFSNQSIT